MKKTGIKLSVAPVGGLFHFPAELLNILTKARYGIAPAKHGNHKPHQDAKSELLHRSPPQHN